MKIIIPVILILVSGGIYLGYINGVYDQIKELKVEEEQYAEALKRSEDLNAIHDRLLTIYNGISTRDLERLEKLLPDTIDSIRLLIDMDGIAAKNGLTLSGLSAQPESTDNEPGTVGVVQMQFSTIASYQKFKDFMRDVESSLRVFDINSLSFNQTAGGGDNFNYSVDISTYWMN